MKTFPKTALHTQVSLVLRSSNRKTGPIPTSTASRETCPLSCPHHADNNGTCYGEGHHLAMHWDKITKGERGTDWSTFCSAVSALPPETLWRHDVAGDLPRIGKQIDTESLAMLIQANHGKRGFTFCHHDMSVRANQLLVRQANHAGFTVNLSADSPTKADALADLDIGPVVLTAPIGTTKPFRTPAGRQCAICPHSLNPTIQCIKCGVCADPERKAVVVFPAHGNHAAKIQWNLTT